MHLQGNKRSTAGIISEPCCEQGPWRACAICRVTPRGVTPSRQCGPYVRMQLQPAMEAPVKYWPVGKVPVCPYQTKMNRACITLRAHVTFVLCLLRAASSI